MGAGADADIEAFQERTGIKPAKGAYADKLDRLSQAAFDLIKIIEIERCGIRDGNGFWHGSDAMDGSVREIQSIWDEEHGRDGANPDTDEMPFYETFDGDTGELPEYETA
jgi:hypothetical protein